MARIGKLVGFYLLACLWTWACWLAILAERQDWLNLHGNLERLATLGQFGPFVSAIVWTWIERRGAGLRDLAQRLVRIPASVACLAVALLLPPLLFFFAIEINVWLGNQTAPALAFPEPIGTTLHFLVNMAIGGALGEEPGWRGYALPRLRERSSPLAASLVLAMSWACWHWPLWLIADVPSSFSAYVLGMIPLTILFTWLDDWGRGSVLVALLFHASLNTSLVRLPVFPAIVVVNVLYACLAVAIIARRWRWWLQRP